MNCTQIRNLLHAFVDGELDLVRHLEIEQHLLDCSSCAGEHEGLRTLGAALKTDGLYCRAPTGLSDRVRASLRRAAEPEKASPRISLRWRRLGIGLAVAASIALFVGGVTLAEWNLRRSGPSEDDRLAREIIANHMRFFQAPHSTDDDRLAREVVSDHIRSLQAEHLTDVISSDKHVVKPWFKGKVDFSPLVCDLAGAGYPLLGGRLDYLDNRPVAALVYRRRLHVINLFIWPAAEKTERGPRTCDRNGYHVVQWDVGGMTWCAVSDLNSEELREFVDKVTKEARPAQP